ncbi:uncharacterized protein LOC112347825 [Selaginella moellendorffii]|uniref:uncharacterized protein LOC112347825 n=1 Tax=Selaginella moellendorffii TaxID=88036 RepID=UPI000D1D056F|nr:uncharacterized protein LOC112347825 [Selaginella moellendorffii]|eukprot:XP_024535080.1 uncharacterized protein LOC112347825 [Selaginella moellendorffii]
MPKPDVEPESAGAENGAQATNQIQFCVFNVDGSYFVTGSSDKLARVWDARKWMDEYTPEGEIMSMTFSVATRMNGCAEPIKVSSVDFFKDDKIAETYVPDVHPCNPHIAMSPGYDGRDLAGPSSKNI